MSTSPIVPIPTLDLKEVAKDQKDRPRPETGGRTEAALSGRIVNLSARFFSAVKRKGKSSKHSKYGEKNDVMAMNALWWRSVCLERERQESLPTKVYPSIEEFCRRHPYSVTNLCLLPSESFSVLASHKLAASVNLFEASVYSEAVADDGSIMKSHLPPKLHKEKATKQSNKFSTKLTLFPSFFRPSKEEVFPDTDGSIRSTSLVSGILLDQTSEPGGKRPHSILSFETDYDTDRTNTLPEDSGPQYKRQHSSPPSNHLRKEFKFSLTSTANVTIMSVNEPLEVCGKPDRRRDSITDANSIINRETQDYCQRSLQRETPILKPKRPPPGPVDGATTIPSHQSPNQQVTVSQPKTPETQPHSATGTSKFAGKKKPPPSPPTSKKASSLTTHEPKAPMNKKAPPPFYKKSPPSAEVGSAKAPAPASVEAQTPKKVISTGIVDRAPLGKRIHWKPLGRDQMENTVFAELPSGSGQKLYFTVDSGVMKRVFAKTVPVKVEKKSHCGDDGPKPAAASRTIVPPHRAQNISIVVLRLKHSPKDLSDSLLNLILKDNMTCDDLSKIEAVTLNEEEDQEMTKFFAGGGLKEDLRDIPERRLCELRPSVIPRLPQRCAILMYELNRDTLIQDFQSDLDIIEMASMEMKDCVLFRELLAVVLKWGNFVNHGTHNEMLTRGITLGMKNMF